MDPNIKNELIDRMDQLVIGHEPSALIEHQLRSYYCSVSATKMDYDVTQASLVIDYNVQVLVTQAGIHVFVKNGFEHIYTHSQAQRRYSARSIYSMVEVCIKSVSRPAITVGDQGSQMVATDVYDLHLKFADANAFVDFCIELRNQGYVSMPWG